MRCCGQQYGTARLVAQSCMLWENPCFVPLHHIRVTPTLPKACMRDKDCNLSLEFGLPCSDFHNFLPGMQSALSVVVTNFEDIELFREDLHPATTVGDLKGRLYDTDQLCVDLFTKNKKTCEWTRLLSSEMCRLDKVRDHIAHRRQDGALHLRAKQGAVWRTQAFIGVFADPFVVRLHCAFRGLFESFCAR
jgi:hypothetical protein